MTKKSNTTIDISQKSDYSYMSIIIWGGIFFFFLLMRDAYSVGINKYIFLAIICVCAVYMKTNHLIYLFCFLFPLYVGLPGNYMTLVLIVRLGFEIHRFKVSSFMLSVAIAIYMFIQNIMTGYTGIVPMMFIAGIVLILLLFTYRRNLEALPMVLMYSAGVAALGFIMLSSTLKVYDLTDLMSVSFRLGSSSVDYVDEGIMNVSVDPNFYGMFSIASISMAFPLLFQPKIKPIVKALLLFFSLTQLIVCLIGLSRAFILVFVLPGIGSYFINKAIDWNFGFWGAIFLYAMGVLFINSSTEKVWKNNHYEEETTRFFSRKVDTICILVILGVIGYGIYRICVN